MSHFDSIDIFCEIIDNFGDAGVVYRFAREYKISNPHVNVRVIFSSIESVSPLITLNNSSSDSAVNFEINEYSDFTNKSHYLPAELIIEAFGCHIPEEFLLEIRKNSKLIINLEYLSAENWIEGYHQIQSLSEGKAIRYFFYPGFTPKSGGLILDSHISYSDEFPQHIRKKRLQKFLIKNFWLSENNDETIVVSIFSYEHDFTGLVKTFEIIDKPFYLLVFGERSQNSFRHLFQKLSFKRTTDVWIFKKVSVRFCQFLPQTEYDYFLNLTDFNIVRGEDSWARACLSTRPYIWHAYCQNEKYQLTKVEAFLKLIKVFYDDVDIFETYSEMLLQFNNRENNSYLAESETDYAGFITNLNTISKYQLQFRRYLVNNCNLIANLNNFLHECKNKLN
ncbi:MAG: elongation factor P maturation arginine rhamnosyltransferase EarP [Candidatus Cloacimonetes bacterium]|nr:elongation factor P maturation arginine rhamnosyltransferase EarP [Candidatus Cloacimonadota bacterium]